jgi:6-phosphogluconolactonase
MSLHAAKLFDALSKGAIGARGKFRAALSGGSTPLRLYSLLAAEPYRSKVDWRHIELFLGDERCVPPDHHNSNFNSINEALLSHVPVKSHRIEGELSPEEAALRYEGELLRAFDMQDGIPVFDLMLLGLGDDGHTASLFPGSTALKETTKLSAAVYAGELKGWRVTLTFPVINGARKVMFMVSGDGKAQVVKEVLDGKKPYPASLVAPLRGEVLWLLDKGAASLI